MVSRTLDSLSKPKRMVSEYSTTGVLPFKQQNPNLPQHKEFTTKFSPQNTFFPASKLSSFHEPQTSRKRPRICEQEPSFQQSVATNPVNVGLGDKNSSRKQDFHFVSWPNYFTFQSNEVNKSVQQGSEAKQPSFSVKNHQQLLGKSSTSGVGMNLSNAGLFTLDGINVGGGKEEVDSSVDFSKAIEDAISRIESLIPSLQKLVKNDHSLEQKSDDNLSLPKFSSSVNPLGKEKDLVATNELQFQAEREVTLRPCTQVQPAGSTSSMRRNRTSYTPSSHQKWSHSRTSGRIAQEMGQSSKMIQSRDSLGRIKGPLHSKVAPHDQVSEETSWNSYTSSDSTAQQSDSPSYSSGSYESSGSDGYDNDESEPLHEKAGYSTRMKHPEFSDSTASGSADTSSYSNSRDDYSEAESSSQMSSARIHKWDPQKERGKRRGRLKRLGRKLGMIFHHHHHHHHHHYRDEPDPRHARSFWKRLGEMFHHSRNANHHQKQKSEKPRKSDVKTVAKRKQQGHFHALVSGLMKHMKHSKKPKQLKSDFKGLGSGHHGGKKKGKKLLWWPKVDGGRGGVKVSNKGKVRLGNYRTKSFAAAKMILKK